ncbi:helix-turn-helix domain-containing protein [Robertmurraya kyonggiensis]|uniref:Helix-turn-helix transcriptional regulator n=1 Tax=Robertmurraya kyonggiensis TaxID=1037680 RepID=A0A4U1D191_9BACI|nr:helix-turn-helix domain-containing protein [Robertmurraya kyonggiensis]TKC15834.1 helix-turn-helix transcriptional regulator [Robertmurraya kyonggiensis]
MNLEELCFGDILKSIRIQRGYTVESLSDGICTPEELDEFEKEIKYPTIDQLFKMSQKLNVNLSNFFDFGATSSFRYDIAVMELIKKFKYERDYHSILEVVVKEKDNAFFKHTSYQQFLIWHEGICKYYLQNKKDESIELLQYALGLTNPARTNLTEREIEILTSMAIIEKDFGNFELSKEMLLDALNHTDNLPHLLDPRVKVRILYAIAQVLTKQEKYEESLKYCKNGINHCINSQDMLLFPDFHYQIGENLLKSGAILKGKQYIADAIYIFKLQKNDKFAKLVEEELEKLLK